MSIESHIRDEFRTRHHSTGSWSNIDFEKLDAELQGDNPAFTNLRVNLHELEFTCAERLAMWRRLSPLRQRAIVAVGFYLGIDAVIALKLNHSCQRGRLEEAACAVESSALPKLNPGAAGRIAAMFRAGRIPE